MIRSMTGFGDATSQVGGAHYFVEVRSLNSKYFKAVIRLPEELQALEAELDSILRHRLVRGSVFMTVRFADSSEEAAYGVNQNVLDRYITALKQVPQIESGEVTMDLGALLSLPGVLQPPGNEEERLERARAAIRDVLEKALAHLISMRVREGHAILADLEMHGRLIAEKLELVRERAPSISADYETRLRTRIQTVIDQAGLTVEAIDVIREVASYGERTDISEEIARLSAHLEQFFEIVSEQEARPVGRTLDFIAQEMLREANTIASKCADADISRWTVEIKGAIDRIKEQVQNIE